MELSQSLTVRLLEDYPSNDEKEKSEQFEKAKAIPIKSESIKNEISQPKNQIILKLEIWKSYIGQKVYFLDNYEHNLSNYPNKNLEELNKSNTKLFINEKEYKYQNYFVPSEQGIYTIRLVFNILIKDCSFMFRCCEIINSIDLSSFNTSEVINMSYMFFNCHYLTSINFGSFNTTNVKEMSSMFYNCNNLYSIDLSSFNTNNVNSMAYMFYDCDNLYSIDLSSFNIKNVNSMVYMFSNCKNLNFIDLPSFDNNNINTDNMINGCYNLKKIKAKKKYIFKNMYNLDDNNNKSLKRNYCLYNTIQYKFNSSEELFKYSKFIKKELNECLFDMGFQIFSFNDKTLFGVMEGPILSPYQNGFFLFKMIIPVDYPFKPPKFYFITKIFHPNIDKDGLISADIFEREWSPNLRIRTTILSVQSLLGDPNFVNFVNQDAASLYNINKEEYYEKILEYVNNYATYSIYKEKVKEFEVKDLFDIFDD